MNFKQFVPPITGSIYRRVKGVLRSKYKIGKYEIKIPRNYAIPTIQKIYKLYDRFLPVLAKNINSNQTIIDVGANIGDTVTTLVQCCTNPIYCFEPSDKYYPYLKKNIELFSPNDFNRVKTNKNLIGTGSIKGTLIHYHNGTAALKVDETIDTITHIALDDIVDDVSDIVLVKIDTDGYDFDVIQSAIKILSKSEPILFWENYIAEDFQLKGFNDMYDMLENKGYHYIYIFDCFGELITEENNFSTLKNINSYLYSKKKYNRTQTNDFTYTDILASTEKNYLTVQKAIKEYKTDWINKV